MIGQAFVAAWALALGAGGEGLIALLVDVSALTDDCGFRRGLSHCRVPLWA